MRDLQAARGTALSARKRFGPVQLLALGIAALGLGVDQLTKLAALTHLTPGEPEPLVGSWFQLSLYFNPGAAFGMGSSMTLVFSIFAILAFLGCLFIALPRIRRASHAVALGLLLAGVSGNLWDRIFQPPSVLLGHVIDFFALRHFAVFNVADICITVAAGLILLLSFASDRADQRAAEEAEPLEPTDEDAP